MKIWKHGTRVKLSFGEGVIIGVLIEDTLVKYSIAYYNDDYVQSFFQECEFSVEEGEKEEIGFR